MGTVCGWVGATTPTSGRVRAKVDGSSARLAVADNSEFVGPQMFGPATPDGDGWVSFVASGLDPDTRYWWAVEVDSTLDLSIVGRLRTHPPLGEPADFTFWASACAGGGPVTPGISGDVLAHERLSNHQVFDRIRTHTADPLFGWHAGDLTYYDLGSGQHGISGGSSLANYRRMFQDVLVGAPRQHQLYRTVPLFYSPDDHDYGPNNSDRTHPGRANFQQGYRDRVPHGPLADDEGVYFRFQVGRVLFLAADVRSFRDPNSEPDGQGKTMLGSGQKQWMEQQLAAAHNQGVELVVWLQPDRWLTPVPSGGAGLDNWGSFDHERSELATMFGDLGWSDRMCIVQGDHHSIGLSNGSHPYGGMPVYQLAPLDSGVSAQDPAFTWTANGRGSFGMVRVDDRGDRLVTSCRAFIMDSQVASHQFTVTATDGPSSPPPTPPPAPEDVAVARARLQTEVTWLACNATSGQVITELADVTGGTPGRLLGAYTSTALQIPVPTVGPPSVSLRQKAALAAQATQPGRTLLVMVVNDMPAWAGLIVKRKGGTDGIINVSCVTPEGYLDRRLVKDHDFRQVDQASIAAALLGDAEDIDGIGQGLGLTIDAPASGRLRDRTYHASDRVTVYRRLQELMAVRDGPEFTIDVDWQEGMEGRAVRLVARVRNRIGAVSDSPHAMFETKSETNAVYMFEESYGDGDGANWITAYASGQGDDQLVSAPAIDVDKLSQGWPIYERTWNPSSSISNVDTLNDHAVSELELLRDGGRLVDITSRWNVRPHYGLDWFLGDDAGWHLFGHRHPAGMSGRGRIVGWDLNLDQGTRRLHVLVAQLVEPPPVQPPRQQGASLLTEAGDMIVTEAGARLIVEV